MIVLLNLQSAGTFQSAGASDYLVEMTVSFEADSEGDYNLGLEALSISIGGVAYDPQNIDFTNLSDASIPVGTLFNDGLELLSFGGSFLAENAANSVDLSFDIYADTGFDSVLYAEGITPEQIVTSGLVLDFTTGSSLGLNSIEIAPVPEVESSFLLLTGLVAAFYRRKRNR